METYVSLGQTTAAQRSHQRAAWLLVSASSVGLFFHFGSLLVNSFGVFLTVLCEEFQWSRGQVSLAFGMATLSAILSMPVTGRVADRIGARRPILLCTAIFGALFASLSMLPGKLWVLYTIFLLLGFVGPGTSAVPHASVISRWFNERRGLALGVAMCGTAFGGVIWPSATQGLLDRFGWRSTYALMGGGVLLIAIPLLLAFLKDPAASVSSVETNASNESAGESTGMTAARARRSGLLWMLIAVYFIVAASIQACMIHLVPMLKDRGMSPTNAAVAASVMGAASMAGRLGTGYLLDLLPAARVPVLAFGCVATGIFLLATGIGAYPAAILIGFGYGAESATIPYLVSRYFGMRSFGEIYSYLFITVPVGGALGPAVMGLGYDRWGSYQLILLGWGIATVLSAALLLRLKSYPVYGAKVIE